MAGENETASNTPDFKQKALNALNKARTEALEAKLKEKFKTLQEHQRSVRQVEREIDQLIEDFENGL